MGLLCLWLFFCNMHPFINLIRRATYFVFRNWNWQRVELAELWTFISSCCFLLWQRLLSISVPLKEPPSSFLIINDIYHHHRRSGYTVCHSGRSSVRLCFAPNPPLLNPAACQLPTLSTLFYSKLIQHFQLTLFYFYIEPFTFWRNNSFPDQIKIVISP